MKFVRNITYTLIILFLFTGMANLSAAGKWSFDLESGPVTAGSNTVQVPNPGGTRFSLTDLFSIERKVYYRLRLTYNLARKHQLSVLYAPLTLHASGVLPSQVLFQNTAFETGDLIEALYKFNSYRLTYRYLISDKKKLKLWIGFTAKIRDAEISLSSPMKLFSGFSSTQGEAKTTNVGFVPLLNFVADWRFAQGRGIILEADALASPGGQGRAEDVSLAYYHNLNKSLRLRAGYRFVEGGADVESVYNFAFLSFFFIGIQLSF